MYKKVRRNDVYKSIFYSADEFCKEYAERIEEKIRSIQNNLQKTLSGSIQGV
jgi:hypothetical protein